MNEAHNEMGRVARLKADAVGEPGERYFRLTVESIKGRSAVMWMEKEQMFRLGTALVELAAETEREGTGRGDLSSPTEPEQSTAGPELEFQVSRISVGYDPQITLFVIAFYDEESDEEDDEGSMPTMNLMATYEEVEALAEEALAVCAAGRPLCSLCGAPMEKDFHMCPALDGHGGIEI